MSHQHALYTDEESKQTIGSNNLPTPMGWKILVHPNQVKKKTKGGIYLPSKAQDNEAYLTAHGTIASIGELAYRDRETGERWKLSIIPKVGDKVTYGKYAGQKIIVNGVRFLILNDDEITSLVNNNTEITSYL